MTTEQDHAVETISLVHRGIPLAIRGGFADKHITATLPDGQRLHLDEDGYTTHREAVAPRG